MIVSGQPMDTRRYPTTALGYIGKPYLPDELLASIDAAEKIIRGDKPMTIPDVLTLFADTLPARHKEAVIPLPTGKSVRRAI